ncbi:LOW QUALITY PROTEIN: hypothetical protein BRARA_J00690 [Brassica rapa]|uniref:Uncharacterized protein n=1 Tax=Brassica campestris TaxID=3711 RepID=A0A397XIS6_BRACM|nr:LOW QUALITY PROTEIN: hypothetical protein BRARA_J00690 [Brassica rapa]
MQPDPDWAITLDHLANRSHDRLTSILLRLAFQVTVYYIWSKPAKPGHYLARVIDKSIRNCITSTRYFEKSKLVGLLQRWFTSME